MKFPSRFSRHLAAIPVLVAIALLAAACSDPAGSSATPTDPAATSASPAPTSSPIRSDQATGRPLPFGAVTGRPVVYWIHTEWCTTCKRIRPEWPAIVEDYGDLVQLIMVDRDTEAGNAFARSHRIASQPGFVVLDAEGKVTYAGLGPYTPADVRELVARAAGK